MKKTLLLIFIALFVNHLKAQDITGSWMGIIPSAGANLHFVVNITKNAGAGYSGTFDSPDQKVMGVACSKIYRVKDSLFVEIAGGIGYSGLINKDWAIITGVFKQGAIKIPLNIKPISAAERAALSKEPIRPQTPKPPFNYYTEDVEYDNADKGLHYGATFTRPNGDSKYPAVIIISGSGTQDRDGTMLGHKLYWVLADYLTRSGIAVLRVDDRGAGKSTLGNNAQNATSLDFSYDVEASLNYLETRTDVDKKHLGLIGHSEGGMIAPMVAARRKDVSFIVMWGASEVGGAVINTEQNAYNLKKAGIDSAAVKAFENLHQQELKLFASSPSREILDPKILTVYNAWKKGQSQKTLDALYVHDNSIVGMDVLALYHELYDLPWMRFFITYDPVKDLSKVTCSVLAINGTKDTQVNAAANLRLIHAVLSKSGNKDFETVSLPGLNHLLQTAVTGDVSEYEKIDETMSPVALNIICSWIKLHTK